MINNIKKICKYLDNIIIIRNNTIMVNIHINHFQIVFKYGYKQKIEYHMINNKTNYKLILNLEIIININFNNG